VERGIFHLTANIGERHISKLQTRELCVCGRGKGEELFRELGDLVLDMKGSTKGEEERLTSGPLSAGSLVAAGSDGGVTWLSPTG